MRCQLVTTLMRAAAPFLATLWISATHACEPFVEEHPAWASASLRPHRDAFEHCVITEETYRSTVAAWLRDRPSTAVRLESLSLGRAVSLPWLSRLIADGAIERRTWAKRISRARPGERDRLAAEVLRDPKLLQRLAVPFEQSPYAAIGLSYEKILFGRADEYSSHPEKGAVLAPFDAQLWLRLAPRR